jgi:hypothetical protein
MAAIYLAAGNNAGPRGVNVTRIFYLAIYWRDGRAAEGAPLLREYGVNSSIEGSNPSLSAILKKPPSGGFFNMADREASIRTLRFDKIAEGDIERA